MVRPIVVHNNLKRVLDIIRIKLRHLKGENKMESFVGSLDSDELHVIEGLKAAQRNELIVQRHIIAFSSKGRVIRMSATDQ